MSELGNFVREEIRRQKIQHFEMAARLGLSAPHLSQILNGERRGFRDLSIPKLKSWVHVTPPGRTKEEQVDRGHGAIDKVCAALRDLALPTETVESLHLIISAIPHYSALHDLVKDLAEFTRDALTKPPVKAYRDTLSPSQLQKLERGENSDDSPTRKSVRYIEDTSKRSPRMEEKKRKARRL